jgi:hypothetical protein
MIGMILFPDGHQWTASGRIMSCSSCSRIGSARRIHVCRSWGKAQHGIGRPPTHAFPVTTICGFGVRPEDALPLSKATRDCEFCLAELAVIEQQQEKETGRAA